MPSFEIHLNDQSGKLHLTTRRIQSGALETAYGVFQQEALEQNPDYQPESVNTDGWEATKIVWKSLFPSITLILCFLHTVLGVQQRYRRQGGLFRVVTEKLWQVYHRLNRRQFAQRLRRLMEWAENPKTDLPIMLRQKILGLKFNVALSRSQWFSLS
jgi:hypothetical protein